MSNEQVQELRECPFCGGEAYCEKKGNSVAHYVVLCKGCRVKMVGTKEADAVNAWNRRTTVAQEDKAKAALEVDAPQRSWQPLADGKYGGESPDGSDDWWIKIDDNGDTLYQWSASDMEKVEIGSLSFFNMRLCRRVDNPAPQVSEGMDMDLRDLDAQIAERVLGYHREQVPPDASGENGGTDILIEPGKTLGILYTQGIHLPPKGAIGLAYFVPQFSKFHAEAFHLLHRFKPPRYYTRLVITDTGKWRCDIELRGGDGPVCSVAHEDLLMAICLCVLETANKGE